MIDTALENGTATATATDGVTAAVIPAATESGNGGLTGRSGTRDVAAAPVAGAATATGAEIAGTGTVHVSVLVTTTATDESGGIAAPTREETAGATGVVTADVAEAHASRVDVLPSSFGCLCLTSYYG